MKNSKNTDVRELETGAKEYKGTVERDILLSKDYVISSEFPEVIKPTVYEGGKTTSFEKAETKCFLRHLEEKTVLRSLRSTFSQECRDFIFSKFDGTLVEYIADTKDIDIDEVYEKANSRDDLERIPNVLKVVGSRFH